MPAAARLALGSQNCRWLKRIAGSSVLWWDQITTGNCPGITGIYAGISGNRAEVARWKNQQNPGRRNRRLQKQRRQPFYTKWHLDVLGKDNDPKAMRLRELAKTRASKEQQHRKSKTRPRSKNTWQEFTKTLKRSNSLNRGRLPKKSWAWERAPADKQPRRGPRPGSRPVGKLSRSDSRSANMIGNGRTLACRERALVQQSSDALQIFHWNIITGGGVDAGLLTFSERKLVGNSDLMFSRLQKLELW